MKAHGIFKALAHPTRLRILNLLLEEPLCVCELEALLRLPQPMLSRHLAYLRAAGLVTDRRAGIRVHYSLAPGQQTFEVLKKCLRQALLTEAVYREDLEAFRTWRASCCAGATAPSPGIKLPEAEGDRS